MGDPITPTDDIVRTAPTVTVHTRAAWADAWTAQSRLFARRLRFGSSPEGSSAVLSMETGAGWDFDSATLAALDPLDVLGHYVRIGIQLADGTPAPSPFYWYGVITEDGGVRDGAKAHTALGADKHVLREQELLAVGLEILLDKIFVDKSYAQDEDTASETNIIGRPITFNEPHAYKSASEATAVGNRTAAKGTAPNSENVYLFEQDLAAAELWATRDIVEYLVACFQPRDWGDNNLVPIEIDDPDAVLPAWDQPIVSISPSQTLRQVLDRLLDRRRLLGWQLSVDETTTPDTVKLGVVSFVSVAISLPSGETQAANGDTVTIDFDSALDVRAALTLSDRHRADQVIVRGAPKRSCFHLSYDDGTLVSDWTAADEADYEAGGTAVTGTEAEQLRAIIEYRRRDELRQVYAYFKVPDDWNFQVGGGADDSSLSASSSGAGQTRPIHPDLDEATEWLWRPGLRFERQLFAEIHATRTATGAQDAPAPIVVMETEDASFRLGDQLAETAGVIDRGAGKGRNWSVSVRMRDDSPGVILRVSGAQQLAIAESDFGGDVDTDELPHLLDWKDGAVTVALELDACCEARYPAADDVDPGDWGDQRRLVLLDVGKAGRQDYVVPETIIGVTSGGDLVRHAGGYVRDDTDWMGDLARYVFDWYGITRRAFRFRMEQVLDLLTVGQMITSIGTGALELDVNSVVVGVTYDLEAQATYVDTAFANLDEGVLLDWFSGANR